jgi:formylglycine-generating enzyme required for sulfatase activity
MVWIPGGTYTRGASVPGEPAREYPPHKVEVDGFYMDTTEVTNAAFAQFVAATGYITIAERPIDWDSLAAQLPPGTPRPPDSLLAPGALRFSPPEVVLSLRNHLQWWKWQPGASWRTPQGPGSTIDGMDNHPVVQVALADAQAYCRWRGARLPTEAEWEYAARGNLEGRRFVWGDEDPIHNHALANVFYGEFPHQNRPDDGYTGSAPVGSYPPNAFGLYDMAGNVWEWCNDFFDEDYYHTLGTKLCRNPEGPSKSFDSRDPWAQRRVIKGGSYLCHVSYCESYRPSARESAAEDTGMPHLGFRCVADAPARIHR